MLCVLFLNSGCAVFEAERSNRGGYLDRVADDHWFKADSKKMRALRAFAMQTSLARIATVSPKNGKDRQLMAIRIGDASVRAKLLIQCAFGPNPLPVTLSKGDECFYFDSLMVDYTTSLFDLAMIAFPIEDTKNLINLVVGGFTGPVGALDALNALLNLAKDALKYGRIIGALYRDTLELEVQVWLTSYKEDQANIPEPYKISDKTVIALKTVYDRKNDDVVAWAREIAALRAQGLEPFPQKKHFYELAALNQYLCGLVVSESTESTSPYAICVNGLYLEPETGAISSSAPAAPVAGTKPPAPVAGTKTGALRRNLLSSRFPFLEPPQPTRAVVPIRQQSLSMGGIEKRASLEPAQR